jgi:hypothetical protein
MGQTLAVYCRAFLGRRRGARMFRCKRKGNAAAVG